MKQIFLILLLFVCGAFAGTNHTVGDGGTYATFALANAACTNNNNDTITLLNNDTIKASITIKSTVFIRSADKDTLFVPPTLATYALSAGGNSIKFDNVVLWYTNDTPSGTNYLFYSYGYGGHLFNNCVVDSGNGVSNFQSKRGLSFRKIAGTTTLKTSITNSILNGLMCNAIGPSDTTLADSIEITSCELNRCSWMVGHNYKFLYNKINGFYGETGLFGSNLEYAYNYIDGDGFSGECLSAEQSGKTATKLTNMRIHDNVWIDCGHVVILLDWMVDSDIYKNRFLGSTGTPFYHHNNGAAMRSNSVRIYNNVGNSGVSSQVITFAPKADVSNSDSILFSHNVFMPYGNITIDSVTNVFIDSTVWSYATPTMIITPPDAQYQITYTDTALGRSSTVLLDSTKYLLTKRGTIADSYNAGISTGLVSVLSDTSTSNSISVKCSLSVDYWYDDYIRGDSGQIKLTLSTNKIDWTDADTTTMVYAGDTQTVTATSLSPSTLYYYRLVSDSATTTLTDTTEIDSITTLAGSGGGVDTAKITYSFITAGSTDGGDRVDIVGTGFGTDPDVKLLDDTPVTIKRAVPKLVTVSMPAHSAGATGIIVTPDGGVPDTLTFTYYAPKTVDTVFVDSLITDSTNTYNKTTRSATGGTYKCYRWPQWAINTITTGNNKSVVLRQGTYSGTGDYNSTFGYSTCLSTTQNGVCWADGRYNVFTNYNNERVTIDGRDSIKLVAAGAGSILGRAGYNGYGIKYWKIKGINFVRGVSADSSCAAGIWIELGPFIVDSCTFNIGWIPKETQIEAPAGVKGHGWKNCVVTNSYFTQSEGGVAIYGDYQHVANATNGFVETAAGEKYQSMRNIVKYNYFDSIYVHSFKYKGGQIMSTRDGNFDTTYANCGDTIAYNIARHGGYGARLGIMEAFAGNQDFISIHHNILDSLGSPLMIQYKDLYPFINTKVFNNTIIKGGNADYNCAIYRGATKYFNDTVSEVFDIWGDDINNLIVEPPAYSYRTAIYSTVGFTWHNWHVKNNLLYKAPTNAARITDSTGATNTYTISQLQSLYPFDDLYSTTADGLFRSTYIPDGSYVVDGSTTISNGGLGTDYPSYIGAVDPNDTTWVPQVLSLETLWTGETPEPPPPVATITVQPRDTTVSEGQAATFTVSGENINTYQWYGNETLIDGATNSVYSFTATIELDGSTIYCIVNDTLSSDTVTLTVNPAITQNQSADTLKLVCSVNNATAYQWYKNKVAIEGETDSVLTIIADSAFYASKPYIYCMASNDVDTIVGYEWRYTAGTSVNRWRAFR